MPLKEKGEFSTSLVESKHYRRKAAVEHAGDIMQGIALFLSVSENRFLFRRGVTFYGNLPFFLEIVASPRLTHSHKRTVGRSESIKQKSFLAR
ncbi:hypothetical protein [Pantoea ananatis]|uniref:hypothetical protein n=1 Tax=Pantoea ananas TaxID=553 RepID=UPI001FF0A321|nr:hypothetical protein [Pantoea ananatis]